jgi:hypothetical protein
VTINRREQYLMTMLYSLHPHVRARRLQSLVTMHQGQHVDVTYKLFGGPEGRRTLRCYLVAVASALTGGGTAAEQLIVRIDDGTVFILTGASICDIRRPEVPQ